MELLAYVIYCHETKQELKQTVADHMSRAVGRPMTDNAIESQLYRTAKQLKTQSSSLRMQGANAVDTSRLEDEEKEILNQRLRDLFAPDDPPPLVAKTKKSQMIPNDPIHEPHAFKVCSSIPPTQ